MSDDAEKPPYIQQTVLHVLLLHLRHFPYLRRASFQVSVCTVCQILPSGQKFWPSSVYSRDSPTVSIQVVSRILTATAEKNMDQEAQGIF